MFVLNRLVIGLAAVTFSAAPAFAQPDDRLDERLCVLQVEGESRPYVIEGGILRLTRTEERLSFNVAGRRSGPAQAVHCFRSSVVPAENDYKVVLSGLPLTISEESEDGQRTTVALELADNRFQMRVIEGELSEAELQLAAERIESYSRRLEADGS